MPVSRPIRLILLAAAVAVVFVQPAFAQNSARIVGVVTDHEGTPVEGARVHIDFQGGITRSFETTSNDEGEYIQMGLASGPYIVTYTAEGIGTSRVQPPAIRRAGARAGCTDPRPGTGRPHGDVGRGNSRAGST